MEKVDLAIISSEYGLLIYLFANKNWKRSNYVFCGQIDEQVIQNLENFKTIRILSGEKWKNAGDMIEKYKGKRLFQQYWRMRKECMRLSIQIKILKFCWGHSRKCLWGQTYNFATKIAMKYYFNLIEDGLLNYTGQEVIDGQQVPFGTNGRVKNIYLSGRLPVPRLIENKSVVINMMNRWNNMSSTEKSEITMLFNFNYKKLKSIILSGRNKILLTQDLYRYNYCTQKEQIELYKQILSKYNENEIMIKPHPKDNIEYEKAFPNCYVLREKFPFELCYFTGLPIEKVIAINSTSIYGFLPRNCIDENPDLLKCIMH